MVMWRHFKREEFACKHCGDNRIASVFVDQLDELRERVGFALPVTSGYRCPIHNARVSSTGANGPHTTGFAVDLAVDRARAHKVLEVALQMGFAGVGVQQKGTVRFIHLDTLPQAPGRPRPTVWSY